MRITTKGQVTIPRDVREKMGFLPHSEVEFVVEGNLVYLRKEDGAPKRGQKLDYRLRWRGVIEGGLLKKSH